MHAPFDSTNSVFPSKTNYTKVSKVLCLTSAVSTKIVTSLIAMKTKTHKWPCNPIPHCVLSAMHCHRQQSQTPAGTELNSCLACLALFIASWPRKLKGCLGEGVCMGTALHLCYNLTAWEQLFTCATSWLHEIDSSSPVLQLDCMENSFFTCAFSCNWQQGKSARKMATLALSFLFWGAIITVIIVTFRLGHFCTNEESEGLKKSLEVILHQPGDQPTHASHFHWITVKQARPQGLYATLKIVYIQRTNQTSDSKLLPLA